MKNRISRNLLPLLATLLLVTGCDRNDGIYEDQLHVLGTFAQVSIAGLGHDAAHDAARAAENELLALDYIGYTLSDEGELQKLNSAIAQGHPMKVSDGMLELIQNAVEFSRASGGIFNPSTGKLNAFWEFLCDKQVCSRSPYPDAVQKLVNAETAKILSRHPSMDDLIIDGNTIRSRNRNVQLEFGDIIRGMALDNGIEHLISRGVGNAMIDIGGSARTTGSRGDHSWWIGIPGSTGKHFIGSIENIDDLAVVTVRAFDKSFGKKGTFYRRVVDPRSGAPVKDTLSVTVVHKSAVVANAAATALLTAGTENWKTLADNMDAHRILMITRDGTIFTSPAIEHMVHWKQGIEHQHLVP